MANSTAINKQEKLEKQKEIVNKLMFIPIIVLLAIVPLIMRVQEIALEPALADAMNTDTITDVFSNYKATAIIIVSIGILILTFLVFQKDMIKKDKYIKIYAIGAGVFIFTTFLATIFSNNSNTAWWGLPGRSEGFIITACYILILFYTILSFRNYTNFKWILIALAFLVVVSTVIGAFQYFGYDLFTHVDFFKRLIMSQKQYESIETISGLIEDKTIYGTMFHYNYMGSFAAMMVPLFMTLTLFLRSKKQKLLCGVVTLCSLFLLFGSSSRAGFIGLMLAVLVGILMFGKKIVKKWKVTIPILIALAVVVVGFNAMTRGTIFRRIPTLINESLGLLSGSDNSFNYKDHIPVRDVINEDRSAKIVFQNATLVLGETDGSITFSDETGNPVVYTEVEGVYTPTDERFANVSFTNIDLIVPEGQVAPKVTNMYVNGLSTFLFKTDSAEGTVLCDAYPVQKIDIDEPETIGFKGKEKLGSARGYIWSRSIPMMKDTFLIGYGPDTYAAKFPQNDLLGKWWAYDTPNMIVDKVHNLYLQYFINNGGLALLGFLVLVIAYIIQSFKLYALKGFYENKEIMGIATFLSVMGYLGAGMFNDSVVSVAPIFWILLGTGIVLNFMINQENVEVQKRVAHATVDMKSKKHLC